MTPFHATISRLAAFRVWILEARVMAPESKMGRVWGAPQMASHTDSQQQFLLDTKWPPPTGTRSKPFGVTAWFDFITLRIRKALAAAAASENLENLPTLPTDQLQASSLQGQKQAARDSKSGEIIGNHGFDSTCSTC